MDDRLGRIAALANTSAYDSAGTATYIDAASHIKHASMRTLFAKLLTQVFDHAAKYSNIPTVLDLGAGEGSVTLPFLELGARVTAVDISRNQLDVLSRKCERYADRLELRCEDIAESLRRGQEYDIITALSFLHHIPDYMGMLRQAIRLLARNGQFFSFQDPLRYDTVGKFARAFSEISYLSWRISRGDIWGGFKRRIRRSRGIYLPESVHDNAEYHVTRNGVDQNAIAKLFEDCECDCVVIPYFSTQSRIFQPIGTVLKIQNTFAIIAEVI